MRYKFVYLVDEYVLRGTHERHKSTKTIQIRESKKSEYLIKYLICSYLWINETK